MNNSVIKVEGLGKYYFIKNNTRSSYLSLREELAEKASSLFKKSRTKSSKKEKFWALKDISFDVKQGEVLGIIGRNGAGKSTLLKTLSRITEPSTGTIRLKGRIASLLEVGTGFHPELTGRENIFLSGAILGMKRAEVKKYFDEIVHFSGVEKFLDTPVKRYSSGMFVRLGFAIAAHLQAGILLVDEVLAVGDMDFQKKCIAKINEVSKDGRTILFVSHNLESVSKLCNKGILLDKGGIVHHGNIEDTISKYLTKSNSNSSGDFNFPNRKIRKIWFSDFDGHKTINFDADSGIVLNVEFLLDRKITHPVLGVVIKNKMNTPVIAVNNRHYKKYFKKYLSNAGSFKVGIKKLPFVSGEYFLDVYLGDINGDFEVIEHAASFHFINNSASVQNISSADNIIILDDLEWELLENS